MFKIHVVMCTVYFSINVAMKDMSLHKAVCYHMLPHFYEIKEYLFLNNRGRDLQKPLII